MSRRTEDEDNIPLEMSEINELLSGKKISLKRFEQLIVLIDDVKILEAIRNKLDQENKELYEAVLDQHKKTLDRLPVFLQLKTQVLGDIKKWRDPSDFEGRLWSQDIVEDMLEFLRNEEEDMLLTEKGQVADILDACIQVCEHLSEQQLDAGKAYVLGEMRTQWDWNVLDFEWRLKFTSTLLEMAGILSAELTRNEQKRDYAAVLSCCLQAVVKEMTLDEIKGYVLEKI